MSLGQGFYDRTQLFWKDIEDTTLVAACAPEGGGRQRLSARFVRHFALLAMPPASPAAITTILSTSLNGFLADLPHPVRRPGSHMRSSYPITSEFSLTICQVPLPLFFDSIRSMVLVLFTVYI